MKPRYEPVSQDAKDLLKAALDLEERIAKKEGSMPSYEQKEGSMIGQTRLMTQSGGKDNVQSAYYYTNNSVPEVEDVENKGAISESSDVLTRESPYYPTAFSTTGALENFKGGDGPTMTDVKKSVDRLSSRLL